MAEQDPACRPVLDAGASVPAGRGRGRRRLERWVDERATRANPPRRITTFLPHACIGFTFREGILRRFPGGHALGETPAQPLMTPRKEGGGSKNRMADQTNTQHSPKCPQTSN